MFKIIKKSLEIITVTSKVEYKLLFVVQCNAEIQDFNQY